VARLKDMSSLIEGSRFYEELQFSENSSVWDALQQLSADTLLSEDYENLVKAFNEYRKLQIV
jgi:osmoprotectant transport system ATP-binding protein